MATPSAQVPAEQGPVRPQGLVAAPRTPAPTTTPGRPPAPPPALPAPPVPPGTRPSAPPSQQRGHGRLFQPQDLGMLEGPDREAWQKPDQIMDALGIGDGSVVADLGAGGGWFTVRLAKRVGPNGVVYAEDIQSQMIEAIQRRVAREGLHNVSAVLGAADHPALPVARLDAALMVDTFHEVEDTRSLLTNVRAALKPGGRLGIVEYRTEGGGPGPSREERIPPAQVIRAAEAAGFRLVRQEQFLQFQYLLIFTR
ncbi:class I SAM-dependent methyltransferase [Luteitalea sp.]|uniref:class I SAM-dependent methyltransferase n=1 Tax=Luteitalea sp. TaxID=2004800 RepID=UPI0037C76025